MLAFVCYTCLNLTLFSVLQSLFPDLVNVFEVFLPQLLLYPNPSDPLNGEAAALMMRDRTAYDQRVKGSNCLVSLIVGTNYNVIYVLR